MGSTASGQERPTPEIRSSYVQVHFLILELETASSKTPSASPKSDGYSQTWDSVTRIAFLSTTMTLLNHSDCARTLMYKTQVCANGCHMNEGTPLISRITGKNMLACLTCYGMAVISWAHQLPPRFVIGSNSWHCIKWHDCLYKVVDHR